VEGSRRAEPRPSPQQALARAVELQRQGALAEAEELLRELLDAVPGHAAALFRRGLGLQRLGRHADALACWERLLALQHGSAHAHYYRGLALDGLERPAEALASQDRALAIDARFVEALSARGVALQKLGRPDEALASYDRALALRPAYATALNNRGITLHRLGRTEEALDSYDRALAHRPDYALALVNRGNALHELGRSLEALASYDRALLLRPRDAQALRQRGVALDALGRADEALASFDRALAIDPDLDAALVDRGLTLRGLERDEEALASFERAVAIRPDNAEAWNNRGNTLLALDRTEEAIASYDRALAVRSDFVAVLRNRGNAWHRLNRPHEAIASYERAAALAPDDPQTHWYEGFARLSAGEYEIGWEKLEWRWKEESFAPSRRGFAQPAWQGEPLTGRTILLHAEQGIGDTIHFVRYAPLVAQRGARVLLEVQASLKSLLAGLPGVERTLSPGEPLPEADFHQALMSLPRAFGTTPESIPAEVPYLSVPPGRAAHWSHRLGSAGRPRIGLVWSGHPDLVGDRRRSLPLQALLPLLSLPGFEWVSLQKEVRPADQALLSESGIRHFGDELVDFSDTAALASLVDLVVSVDTAVAHLAGALGLPVWILLPFSPDWRWMFEREDSPWYPTARLFRQPRAGDWTEVLRRVTLEIGRRFGARALGGAEMIIPAAGRERAGR
jgi:tetratricopeptide (TPR) repeat protein